MHYLFGIFFLWCAVPLPQRADIALTQGLGRLVAGCSVELLQWTGVPAEQEGNLVTLPAGSIEISDACAGVRSMQAMLLATLALGEFRRLDLARRCRLVAFGLLLALVFNVIRSFALAKLAAAMGIQAVDAWHDSAGWTVLVASFLVLFAFSAAFAPAPAFRASHPSPVFASAGPERRFGSCVAAIAFTGWFALALIGTELWYRAHETEVGPAQALLVKWPTKQKRFRPISLSGLEMDLLLASNVSIGTWEEGSRGKWTLAVVRWGAGETATALARQHFPEVCLPAAGNTLVGSGPPLEIAVPNGKLLFEVSEFAPRRTGPKAFVFYSLIEGRGTTQTTASISGGPSAWSRLRRAWHGQRNPGEQSVELAIVGPEDVTQAEQEAAQRIPDLLSFDAI